MKLFCILLLSYIWQSSLFAFKFPNDHSFHEEYRLEWCYFVGNLKSTSGEDLGYELSFFRAKVSDKEEIFPVHFAISEPSKHLHHTVDNLHRRFGGLGGYNEKQIWSGDFRLEILNSGSFHITATPRGKNMSLDLHLSVPEESHILPQGESGISPKSRKYPEVYSNYYSIPRLSTEGIISVEGKKYEISNGISWMDHEWSANRGEKQARIGSRDTQWDWICINLEDGTDIMAFNFRNTSQEKSESFGTIRRKDGSIQYMKKDGEILFQPGTKTWKSPKTKKTYSMEWNLKMGPYDFKIEPTFPEQEFIAKDSTRNSYWEGGVRAVDSTSNLSGKGYLELK